MDSFFQRVVRNWHSKRALARCTRVSDKAIQDAQSALQKVELQLSHFVGQLETVTADDEHEGSTLQHTRGILKARSAELRVHVQREIGQLRTALSKKKSRLNRFTVSLFGRTMAGKSTIREAITGGDGSTIGKGAQRMTRDISDYQWRGLTILDTPGFGAFDGKEDRDLAVSVVDESDVIVFLLSSDGIQEEAFQELAALNRLRKPVLFVLNVKHNLAGQSVLKRQFLRSPDDYLGNAAIQPHRNRITTLARQHAPWMAGNIRLAAIHAQAAHLARLPEHKNETARLMSASNIVDLLHILEDELHVHGPTRRVQTIIGGTERALCFIADHLIGISNEFQKEADILDEKHSELENTLTAYMKQFPTRCRDAAQEHFAPVSSGLPRFIDDNIQKRDFKERWKARVNELRTAAWAEGFARQTVEDVKAMVQEFWRQLQVDAAMAFNLDFEGTASSDPADIQKGVRRIGIVIAIAGAILPFLGVVSNPVGWTIAAASLICGIVSIFLSGKGEQLNKDKIEARHKLTSEISAASDSLGQSLQDWFSIQIEDGLIRPLHEELRSFSSAVKKLSCTGVAFSRQLHTIRQDLMSRHVEHLDACEKNPVPTTL